MRKRHAVDPDEFRKQFADALVAEIRGSRCDRTVISDEALYSLPVVSIRQLRAFVEGLGARLHVVVYLRRQDDHLASRYQQVVKTGETRTLVEWSRADHAATYDYAQRLRYWSKEAGARTLQVRVFERASLLNGSVVDDFCALVDIDPSEPGLVAPARRNESLDAASVELLRLCNVHQVEHEGRARHEINNRKAVLALGEHSKGPGLTLPPEELDRFMARWEASNAEVARSYLGRERLFLQERKSANTTTRQSLDLPTAAHLLEQLRLPPEQASALRDAVTSQLTMRVSSSGLAADGVTGG